MWSQPFFFYIETGIPRWFKGKEHWTLKVCAWAEAGPCEISADKAGRINASAVRLGRCRASTSTARLPAALLLQGWWFRAWFRPGYVAVITFLTICMPFFNYVSYCLSSVLGPGCCAGGVELRHPAGSLTASFCPRIAACLQIIGFVGAVGFWPATIFYPVRMWIKLYKPSATKAFWLEVRPVGGSGLVGSLG